MCHSFLYQDYVKATSGIEFVIVCHDTENIKGVIKRSKRFYNRLHSTQTVVATTEHKKHKLKFCASNRKTKTKNFKVIFCMHCIKSSQSQSPNPISGFSQKLNQENNYPNKISNNGRSI